MHVASLEKGIEATQPMVSRYLVPLTLQVLDEVKKWFSVSCIGANPLVTAPKAGKPMMQDLLKEKRFGPVSFIQVSLFHRLNAPDALRHKEIFTHSDSRYIYVYTN